MSEEYVFDDIDEDGNGFEVTIGYCFTPRRSEIMDPERPEPEEPALVEVESIDPEGYMTFEEAEAAVWSMLQDGK